MDRRNARIIPPSALWAPLWLAAVACASPEAVPAHAPAAAASTGLRVEVAEVHPTRTEVDLELGGEVQGDADATLATASGGVVEGVYVRNGEVVRKGQALVALDASLYAASLDQARSQHTLAASELARLETLGKGDVSASQLERARAQAESAEAQLRQARIRASRATVRAPFAGTVTDVRLSVGELAPPGTVVARVVDLDRVQVVAQSPARDVAWLAPGQPVRVSAPAVGSGAEGLVRHVSPVGDARTRSFRVEVDVDNPDHALLPGMVARVHATRPVEGHFVIPQDWTLARHQEHGVFLEVDGLARWRPVTLGRVIRDQVVVETGLDEGDRVILKGQRELRDGDPVRVTRSGVCCTAGRVEHGDGEG